MPLDYTNRKGDVYHLLAGKASKGKPHGCYFSRKPGTPAEAMPEGYEAYELPENGQVVLRKIKPSRINPMERQLVEAAIRSQAGLDHYIVNVEDDALVVYLPDAEKDGLERIFDADFVSAFRRRALVDSAMLYCRYSKIMRFVLLDDARRQFYVERWCFRGSVDGWLSLHDTGTLNELTGKYIRHLGKESFFELF